MIYVMPSIDVSEGKAVKRVRGVRGSGIVVGDPIDIAAELYSSGYEYIHLVDLDAAEGRGDNEDVVRRITEMGFRWVQVGGGIRSLEKASRILSLGASAIVVSTTFYRDVNLFNNILNSVGGEKVLISIDYDSSRRVYISGWSEGYIQLKQAVDMVSNYGVLGVLFTFISNEGTLKGIDRDVCSYAAKVSMLKEYAGGIASLDDLKYLKSCGFNFGVIGMALYQGILRGVRYV